MGTGDIKTSPTVQILWQDIQGGDDRLSLLQSLHRLDAEMQRVLQNKAPEKKRKSCITDYGTIPFLENLQAQLQIAVNRRDFDYLTLNCA